MSAVFFANVVIFVSMLTGKPSVTARIPDGHYIGSRFMMPFFVEVAGDTAFVDILIVQAWGRRLYTDTLYYDAQSQRWGGKTTVLYQRKKKMVIQTTTQTPLYSHNAEITVKPHKRYSEQRLDYKKNEAVWRTFHEPYSSRFTGRTPADVHPQDLQALQIAEEGLNFNLKHTEFLKSFEEFKVRLQRLRAEAGLPVLNLEEIRDPNF
jgi:hypothetical protein